MSDIKDNITLHVGNLFHEFDIKKITMLGRLSGENRGKKLTDILVYVYKNGELVTFDGYVPEGDKMPEPITSRNIIGDNAFIFEYDFLTPGMYTFDVLGTDEAGNKYKMRDFYINMAFGKDEEKA